MYSQTSDPTQKDITKRDVTQQDVTQKDFPQKDFTQKDLTQKDLTQQQQRETYPTQTTQSQSQSSFAQSRVSIKHNFSDVVEKSINDLINVFYFGAYTCRSMQFYFDRDEVALFGMAELNRLKADHQLNFVRKLEDYQVIRGGKVVLTDIKKPDRDEWGTPLDSLQYLIEMKKMQVQKCLKLHEICEKNDDEHLKEYLESKFLEPLYESIRKVGVMITNLQRAGTGLGEYEFNKDVELYLEEILDERKIKRGVDQSVITAYRQQHPFEQSKAHVPHAHHHHHDQHQQFEDVSNLLNVLKNIF